MESKRYRLEKRADGIYRIDNQSGEERKLTDAEVVRFLVGNYDNLYDDDSKSRASDQQFYAALKAVAFEAIMSVAVTDGPDRAKVRELFGTRPEVIRAVYTYDSQLARSIWFPVEIEAALDAAGDESAQEQPREPLAPIGVQPSSAPAAPTTAKDVQTLNNGANGAGTGTSGPGQGNSPTGSAGKPGGKRPGSSPDSDSDEGGTNSKPGTTGGDPVILVSGAFMHQVCDLRLAGRGLSLAFTRTYINQMRYDGPLGHNWDHSYNLFIREQREIAADGTVRNIAYRSTGALREDPYVQLVAPASGDVPPLDQFEDAQFVGPPGYFDRLEKSGGRYVLATPNGTRIFYGADGFAESIVDLNDNTIRLRYADRLLREVVDPVGKRLILSYDPRGRVQSLVDVVGEREVRYFYSSNGDLEEVDLLLGPPSARIVIGHDYRYAGPNAMYGTQHNLLEIIGPTGESVLETTYGDEPGTVEFNRVLAQRSEDGEMLFAYETLSPMASGSGEIDPSSDPLQYVASRTLIQHPNGHVISHYFNGQGNTIRREERCMFGAGQAQTLTATYRYNADGCLIEQTRPDGLRSVWTYGREAYVAMRGGDGADATMGERLSFGNLLRSELHPRPSLAETRRIVFDMTYDRRNLLSRQRGPYYADALGSELPGQAVPEVRYERDARGNVIRTLFADVLCADGTRRVVPPIDVTFDRHGMATRIEHGGYRCAYEYFDDEMRSGFLRVSREGPAEAEQASVFEVDRLGRVTRSTSPLGAQTDVEYTAFDQPSRIVGPTCNGSRPVTTIAYNKHRLAVRSIEQILNADGAPHPEGALLREYRYDRYGRSVETSSGSIVRGIIRRESTVFGANGVVRSCIDARGCVTRLTFDERMLLTHSTVAADSPDAMTTVLSYGRAGEVLSVRAPSGELTTFGYDAFGRRVRTTDAIGTHEELELDAMGNVVSRRLIGRHPDSDETICWRMAQARFDEMGKLIEQRQHRFVPGNEVAGEMVVSTFAYDDRGRLVAADKHGELPSLWRYDELDRLIFASTQGVATSIRYAADNTRVERTVSHIASSPSPAGAPQGTTPSPALTSTTTVEFDSRGLAVRQIDGLGVATEYAFDSRGMCCRIATLDRIAEADFDVFGNVTLQRATTTGAGRGSADAESVRYEYSDDGRLSVLVTPSGQRIDYSYDVLGRLIRRRRNDEVDASIVYDSGGRPIETRDENGVVTRTRYGPSGRVVHQHYDATGFEPIVGLPDYVPLPLPDVEVSYLPTGERHRICHGEHEVVYRYDSLGRVLAERSDGDHYEFAYDQSHRVTRLITPERRELSYAYEPTGLLRQVSILGRPDPDGAGSVGIEPTREPERRAVADIETVGAMPLRIDLGGRLSMRPSYDANLRPVGHQWLHAGTGNRVASERMLRTPHGEIAVHQFQLFDDVGTRSRWFSFDPHGRLSEYSESSDANVDASVEPAHGDVHTPEAILQASTGMIEAVRAGIDASANAQRTRLELAANGNRTRVTTNDSDGNVQSVSYVPGDFDQYVSVEGRSQRYDRAGNLLTDGVRHYRYDVLNRLVEIGEVPGSQRALGSIRLERDAVGRTSRILEPGREQRFSWAGAALFGISTDGRLSHELVPLLRPNQYALVVTPDNEFVPVFDAMDSVVAWIDRDGAVVGRSEYDVFGRLTSRTGDWIAPFGFGGFIEDGRSTLCHMHARAYCPETGRFLQRDPIGFADGFNEYAFAHGAPLTYTDHFGFRTAEVNWGVAVPEILSIIAQSAVGAALVVVLAVGASLASLVGAPLVALGLGAVAIGLMAFGLYSGFSHGYAKAQDAGVGGWGALIAGGGNTLVPTTAIVEAISGYHYGTQIPLTSQERTAATSESVGAAGATLLLGALGKRLFAKPDPLRPTRSEPWGLVVDRSDAELRNLNDYAYSTSDRIPSFSGSPMRGSAKTTRVLRMIFHGLTDDRNSASAVLFSAEVAKKSGLKNWDGWDVTGRITPVELAEWVVNFLKFRGDYIYLDSCGVGLPNQALGGAAFGEVFAAALARALKKPVTVEAPPGLLNVSEDGATQVIRYVADANNAVTRLWVSFTARP